MKNGGVYEGVLRTVSSKVNQNYIRDEKIFFDLCNTSCKLTVDALRFGLGILIINLQAR